VSQYQNFTSAYMGTVVGVGAIYGVIVAFALCFLMLSLFIPVPIKAKYFVPGLVLVVFRSLGTIYFWWRRYRTFLTLRCFIWF
jgi:predicted benzoate:H+ symporter BenE